jgi:hypothetical protein
MNEKKEPSDLERLLEQATAAESNDTLDAEAASLREGWLALGKSLEAGNSPDVGMTERLLQIPNDAGFSHVREKFSSPRRNWAKYGSLVSAAAVVTVILAVGMLKFSPTIAPPKDTDTDIFGNSMVEDRETPERRAILAWDDALDGRMERIEQRLTAAQYGTASLGYSYDNIRSQLNYLSLELELNAM